MPERIQRKRIKGWKMPPNTISVCRPGKWGNPFRVGHEVSNAAEAVQSYRNILLAYELPDMTELRGKNLACFCALDRPCHADILLELANGTAHAPAKCQTGDQRS